MGNRGTRTARTALVASSLAVLIFLSGCAGSGTSPNASAAHPSPTPTASVEVAEIAQGDQNEPVDVQFAGPVQVNFREITLHPGGSTGEHCHYGNLIAVVKQGVFTHYAQMHPGGSAVYTAGQSIIEGSGYTHEGKNEGTEDVVLWVTYVTPEGRPLAETDLANCQE